MFNHLKVKKDPQTSELNHELNENVIKLLIKHFAKNLEKVLLLYIKILALENTVLKIF